MSITSSVKSGISSQSGCASRLLADEQGMAAVEFAFIIPLALLMFFGIVEISTGVATDRKVSLTARTLSDLVSQGTSVTNQDISNFFTVGKSIMTPYSATPMTLRVSAVNIDNSGAATIGWSDSYNVGARSVGSTVSIPAGLAVSNTQLIWSEVTYTYTTVAAYVIKNALTLNDQCFTRPRQSLTVARTAS